MSYLYVIVELLYSNRCENTRNNSCLVHLYPNYISLNIHFSISFETFRHIYVSNKNLIDDNSK